MRKIIQYRLESLVYCFYQIEAALRLVISIHVALCMSNEIIKIESLEMDSLQLQIKIYEVKIYVFFYIYECIIKNIYNKHLFISVYSPSLM